MEGSRIVRIRVRADRIECHLYLDDTVPLAGRERRRVARRHELHRRIAPVEVAELKALRPDSARQHDGTGRLVDPPEVAAGELVGDVLGGGDEPAVAVE